MKFDLKIISCLLRLFDKISVIFNSILLELFFTILRIFYSGSWIIDNFEIYRILIKFIKSRIVWILQVSKDSQLNLISLVFLKILRMIGENTCIFGSLNDKRLNYHEILVDEIYIITSLWESKKEDVLLGGKELFRQIISMSKNKIPELQKIFEEISKMQMYNNQPLYVNLLYTPHPYNYNFYTLVMIPHYMEKMIKFILLEVHRNNYVWYTNFLFRTFKLTSTETDKSLIVDLTRYLITNFYNQKDYNTPRWIVLGFILNNVKNDLIGGEVKQAIFFDWLFFNKEKDNLLLLEPAIMLIYGFAKSFPEISMELIDFLDAYSKNFDNYLKNDIKNNIISAFKECERQQIIQNLEYILREEKIDKQIKQIFSKLIDYKENSQQIQQQQLQKENLDKIPNISTNQQNQNNFSSTINQEPKVIEDSDISDDEMKTVENNINSQNQINENKPLSKKLTIELEFYIHQNLSDLIQNNILNNFINYRSKKTFQELLDNFINNFLQKLKSKNLLESKLALIDQEVTDIYYHFASFFIKIFKDELELDSVNKFFNLRELNVNANNDYYKSQNDNQNKSVKKKEPKEICNYIVDYFIIKFKNKNEKEISMLAEIINKIIEVYPKFIIRMIGFLIRRFNILKIKRANDFKINNFNSIINNNLSPDRAYIDIINKLFKENNEYLKIRLKLLIDLCVQEGELEFLNIFFQKGLHFFTAIIENDQEIIAKIISYSSVETINKLSLNIHSNPNSMNNPTFNLLTNSEKICKLIEISVDMTIFEQEKLWIIVSSIKNLNKIVSLKDIILSIMNYMKYLFSKQSNEIEIYNFESAKNFITKNLLTTLRLYYISDILLLNEDPLIRIADYLSIFEIPYFFSQEIYEIFKVLSVYINKFPEIFNLFIQEFIKKFENDINKNYYLENFIKIIQELIFIEKFNLFSILFDTNNNTIKDALNKIESYAKVF